MPNQSTPPNPFATHDYTVEEVAGLGTGIDVENHKSYHMPGPGNAVMSGQAGYHDIFVLNPPFGNYEINNFDLKEDVIYLPEGYWFYGENNVWSFARVEGLDLIPAGGTLTGPLEAIGGEAPGGGSALGFRGPIGNSEPQDLTLGDWFVHPDWFSDDQNLTGDVLTAPPPPDVPPSDDQFLADLPKPPPPPDVPPSDDQFLADLPKLPPPPDVSPPDQKLADDLPKPPPHPDVPPPDQKLADDLPTPPDVPPHPDFGSVDFAASHLSGDMLIA